jgi:hypothetical protein
MKSCVFCGRSSPSVKMTNEHVLRNKLRQYIEAMARMQYTDVTWGVDLPPEPRFRTTPQGPLNRPGFRGGSTL